MMNVLNGLGLTLGAGFFSVALNGLLTFALCWFAGKFVLKFTDKIICKIPHIRKIHICSGSSCVHFVM